MAQRSRQAQRREYQEATNPPHGRSLAPLRRGECFPVSLSVVDSRLRSRPGILVEMVYNHERIARIVLALVNRMTSIVRVSEGSDEDASLVEESVPRGCITSGKCGRRRNRGFSVAVEFARWHALWSDEPPQWCCSKPTACTYYILTTNIWHSGAMFLHGNRVWCCSARQSTGSHVEVGIEG